MKTLYLSALIAIMLSVFSGSSWADFNQVETPILDLGNSGGGIVRTVTGNGSEECRDLFNRIIECTEAHEEACYEDAYDDALFQCISMGFSSMGVRIISQNITDRGPGYVKCQNKARCLTDEEALDDLEDQLYPSRDF